MAITFSCYYCKTVIDTADPENWTLHKDDDGHLAHKDLRICEHVLLDRLQVVQEKLEAREDGVSFMCSMPDWAGPWG